ncbi:hypothetical protein HJG60_011886 [Phyllostomus discolor]|uniref:Uncharacterized protein n=1 Tax=Phyllostomus discolor TaxID=89673 RepID=A0A834DW09_9CHIR|nr:hypothetical protein HJG60_011886 [Phyllostomus discolor]
MPSAGPQNAHQGPVGEGRGSEAALPSLQSKAGQAPVGLGTISHHWHRATEAKAPASLRARDWQQPHSLLSCFCRFRCDQPCFKHVSTDPDSVLCGLTGVFVEERAQTHRAEVKRGNRVSSEHIWPCRGAVMSVRNSSQPE